MVTRIRPPILGRYQVLHALHASRESWVYLAEDLRRGGLRCALKIFRMDDARAYESARHEFMTLRALRHPGIAEVYDFGRVDRKELEQARIRLSARSTYRGAPPSDDPLGMGWLARREAEIPESLAYLTSVYYQGLDLREAFRLLFPAEGSGAAVTEDSIGREEAPPASRWRTFLEAIARICEALDAVHIRGLVHYDLKVENILLVPQPTASRPERFDVKILDFGLAEKATTPVGTRVRGTVPFIAPEIIENSAADRRSDIYSLGVSLAAAIGGRPPFPGTGPDEWLRAARGGRRLTLESFRSDLPAGLSSLVDEMVDPDPDRRPRSARVVLERIEKIGGFRLEPIPRKSAPGLPAVGWSRERGMILSEMQNLKRGEAEKSLVIVEGDSDQLLARVADEIEALGRLEGFLVESGFSRSPRQYAYQPFAEIVCRLVQRCAPRDPRVEPFLAVLSLFCPRAAAVAGEKKEGTSALCPLTMRLELHRFLDLATEFFLQAAREQPLLLCLRDLHLAGRESLDLLRSIARNVHLRSRKAEETEGIDTPEPARLLIVGTMGGLDTEWAEETEVASNLATLSEIASEPCATRFRLGKLALEDLPEWLEDRVPEVRCGGETLRRIHDKSTGSVAFLDEMVRRLAGSGGPGQGGERASMALRRRDDVAAEREHDEILQDILLRMPRKAIDATLERVRHLPRDSRVLLEILSIARGHLWLDDMAAAETVLAAAMPSETAANGTGSAAQTRTVRTRIDELEELGFVETREHPEGLRVGVVQPDLAGRIQMQMPEDIRGLIHDALARVLLPRVREEGPTRIPEDVAFHALHSGRREAFVEESMLAAERLSEARAPDAAAQIYERVLEQLGSDSLPMAGAYSTGHEPASPGGSSAKMDSLRLRINERLARIYGDRGQLQKAVEKLTIVSSAQETQTEPLRLARVYRSMGEVYQQSGEPGNAIYFLEKSLKLSQQPVAPAAGPSSGGAGKPGDTAQEAGARRELLVTLLAIAKLHAARENLSEAGRCIRLCLEGDTARYPEIFCPARILEAEILDRQGERSRSLNSVLEALSVAAQSKNPPLHLEVLCALGTSYMSRGEYERAIQSYEQALAVAKELRSKFDMASCYRGLGTIYHNRADHEQALRCFSESLRLGLQIGDLKGIARSFNNLGLVHRLKDDLRKAAECYRRAIDLFGRVNDQHGMAAGMSNLATILELEGKYDEALEYSFRALDKRQKARSRSGTAFSYYRIGKIHQAKGELDKATSFAEKSLQLRREIGEKMGIAYSSLLLAELCLSQGKYDEAHELCRSGLRDFEILENEVGVLVAKEALARVLFALGDLVGARQLLREVLDAARKHDQRALVASCLLNLGRISAETRDLAEARERLAEAEKAFRALRSRREVVEVLLARAATALEAKQVDQADEPLEEAYSLLEELGIRDLVPHYFLLRGMAELESGVGDVETARDFLERGSVEAREVRLPELRARLQHILGIVEVRRGDARLALIHFQEARSILEELCSNLPEDLRHDFFHSRERAEIRASVSALPQSKGGGPAGEAPAKAKAAPATADSRHAEDVLILHRQAMKLHEVAAAVGSEPDLKKLLESIMDAVLELVNAERGFLIVKGGSEPTGTLTVARNLDREEVLAPERKVSESVSRRVLRTGKPVLVRNALGDKRFLGSKSVRELRLRSLVCVPLRFRGQTLGIIYLDNRHRRDAFRQSDLDLLQAFADQAAVAVTNARLIEENRRRHLELQDASRKTETLNVKLRRMVHRRNAQLALAREDLRERQSQLEDRYQFQNIIGKSEAMQEVFYLLERVSGTALPVLIEGESGTGKDLVARAIHFNSPRREQHFVSQSCGTLTENLFETELFGHTRGAFTGAIADKKGLLEVADGGTLFLDDVEDLGQALQQKLLRVLEEGEIRRVGGKDCVHVDFRLVSASAQDLEALVREGSFRGDLYYRLNGIKIRLPSLRERREDIPLLAEAFANQVASRSGTAVRRFHPAALRALMAYDWPGNVRELRHLIERTLLVAPGDTVREEDLVFDVSGRPGASSAYSTSSGQSHARGRAAADEGRSKDAAEAYRNVDSLKSVRAGSEKAFLAWCLEETGGNVSATAKKCRISRESLYRLLRKHGLHPRV